MIVSVQIIQISGQMEDVGSGKQRKPIWMRSNKRDISILFFSNILLNRSNQKMFATEEKMVKEMEILSLELANINNVKTLPNPTPPVDE